MSHFYGTLRGSRGIATRCGTKQSGISTSAQSYDGSVIVHMYGDPPQVTIGIARDSSSRYDFERITVPLADLLAPNARLTLTTTKEN